MTQPEIFVIRHGQTEWNVERRHQGRLDSPLTELGVKQAQDMGAMLVRELEARSDISVFSSPQGRALNTAQLATESLGLPITQDARLCEISFGEWEGLTQAQIDAGWPDQATYAEQNPVEWHFSSPGGESLHDLQVRADSFLDDLSGPAVVFTHGILSRVLRARWLGLNEYEMLDLPGGQGIIFHLSPAHGHRVIEK